MSADARDSNLFTPGPSLAEVPQADIARQAVASLKGYAFQIAASTLAWCDLKPGDRLYLEVAEDYAVTAQDILDAVQVKDTAGSGSVTLNTEGVRQAIGAYVDLVRRNPGKRVSLRYLTTSSIGTEGNLADRPAGIAGLEYWRKAAAQADVAPLRPFLEGERFPNAVRDFVRSRDDDNLRSELLQKIHWDCGKPDLAAIRAELEERLIVLGRDRFRLPTEEARRLSDVIMHHVLKKAALKNADERVLTHSELDNLIDQATRISLPRASIDQLVRVIPNLASALSSENLSQDALSVSISADWLIDLSELPVPKQLITRSQTEGLVRSAIANHGVAILVGGTGLGKSLLARSVARQTNSAVSILDLRDIPALEARHRLNALLGRIGDQGVGGLILDDLNDIDDNGVGLALGRVLTSIRRRDIFGVMTSYRRPSARALSELGLDAGVVVEVPYFSEGEVAAVVQAAKGDIKKWSRVAFIAGGFGHPQLTHAFAAGMAARNWPPEALEQFVQSGLTSEEIEAARETARRNLVAALPDNARTLLYRTSLITGSFNRDLALKIAALSPAIRNGGEALDHLIGPWLEARTNTYRVSPLATKAGQEILLPDEKRAVHNLVATELIARKKIDASDVDIIIAHAMLGKSAWALVAVANSILTADEKTLELLSKYGLLFRFFQTDQLIFPENPSASGFLRLAQFKILALSEESDRIKSCADAALAEAKKMPAGQVRKLFDAMAVATILSSKGIANHLPNWVELLQRFVKIVKGDRDFFQMAKSFEAGASSESVSFLGFMFTIGTTGLSSVARLEAIFDDLDNVSVEDRTTLLQDFARRPGDYGLLINGPWVIERTRPSFDWSDAAERYQRMALRAQTWELRELAIHCHAARVVMLDEYGNDAEAAFRAVEEAIAAVGDDIVLARSRVKVLWHNNRHREVMSIVRKIADRIGEESPIERAFALREAAISAFHTKNFEQSEKWFSEASLSASKAQTDDMKSMSIGLLADAAVASYKADNYHSAIEGFRSALERLSSLDPQISLRTMYCHKVVRHAVLWLTARVRNENVTIDGKEIAVLPGVCSNPEPNPAIEKSPLGPIDYAWYMLAEAEVLLWRRGEDRARATQLSD